ARIGIARICMLMNIYTGRVRCQLFFLEPVPVYPALPGATFFAPCTRHALAFPAAECYESDSPAMAATCKSAGCKTTVPAALDDRQLCILHYTLLLEHSCGEMRRETALGNTPHERQKEIIQFITENGERLARGATSGLHLNDDSKARILSTFLTLMNLRGNPHRPAMRTPFWRSGGPA